MARYRTRNYILQAVLPVKTLSHRISIFIFVSLAGFLIIFGRVDHGFISKIRTKVTDVVAPVIEFLSRPADAIVDLRNSVANYFYVYSENKTLRYENEKLKKIQSLANQLAVENKQLKAFLNYAPEPGVKYISGRIAGETGGAYIRSAIINVGAEDNVKKGEIVMNQDGVIGRISEVGELSSRILLITDFNSRIPVITGESKELGIVSGTNTPMLKLLFVPNDTKMKVGEEVFTSGDGEYFPSGLLVGYIQSISDNNIIIKPAANWSKVEFISVVDYTKK